MVRRFSKDADSESNTATLLTYFRARLEKYSVDKEFKSTKTEMELYHKKMISCSLMLMFRSKRTPTKLFQNKSW